MDRATYVLIENYMLSCADESAHDKEHIYRVLYEGATAKEVVQDLLTRPGREEQEDAGWL